MAEENLLKIELARLQAEVRSLEDDIQNLVKSKDRIGPMAESQKQRAIADAKSAFESRQVKEQKEVSKICQSMHDRANDLLDTFPGLKAKEYAGKYEVEAIEEKLAEFYPRSLLEAYVCPGVISFDTEGEAYTAYAYVERKVARLRNSTFASALFSGLTNLMSKVCKNEGASSKVAFCVIACIALSFVLSPFLFLTLFALLGCVSVIQGYIVKDILRKLYSVKAFLNETYDEDIFQADKTSIMKQVDSYLDDVKRSYIEEINMREFRMNPQVLEEIEKSSRASLERAESAIALKQQLLDAKRQEANSKLAEYDAARKQREELAKRAKKDYLEVIDWKREWLNNILLDVTQDNRIQGCTWKQGNTLYYSDSIDALQTFCQLAIYQSMLKMSPDYCGQVVLDYKYMGSNLVQFSQVTPNIFMLCTDKEGIEKRVERIRDDIKARCSSILRTCESIEEFNQLMATYDSTGESYVLVHICGLQSITPDLRMFLKNGPKVGYFFKIYATVEEYREFAKDMPYSDISEYAEISSTVMPRTVSQLRRLSE